MKEEPDDIIDGDLAHLSGNYPNTGAGKGEISDEQWINSRPLLKSSMGLSFNLMSEGGETSEALRNFEVALRKAIIKGDDYANK